MNRSRIATALLAAALVPAALIAVPARAQTTAQATMQTPLKIGMVVTLSGALGAIGQEQVDGFQLGLDQRGGRLGGQAVQVIRLDDQGRPEIGVQHTRKLIEQDKVDLIVGVTASNVINAVAPVITAAGIPFLGTNGGPSPLAGEQCSPLFVSTAFQNDGPHESMGQYAQQQGYKRVVVMAPNYQAGKDAIAGFKRFYKGQVAAEVLPALGQADFAVELTQMQAARPDAVFAFFPGGMGINFVKQWQQAGLGATLPLLSAFTVDDMTLPALRDAAVGVVTGAHWTSSMATPAARKFVADYETKFKKRPSNYAVQGYDAAMLLDQALERTKGNPMDARDLVRTMRSIRLESPRGTIGFGPNGFPVQDYAAWTTVKQPDGAVGFQLRGVMLKEHRDAYVGQCKG